jgi:radical SAM superfamily enzyme
MKVIEIKRLLSKLNKDNKITGIWKMNKAQLLSKISELKYELDEDNKRLVPKVEMKRRKVIKL